MTSAYNPEEYNFYHSIYQNDLSRWGGLTYRKPENISREIDINAAAAESSTVTRCMKSMRTGCKPVYTPNSLQRDSYVPHFPVTRDVGPTFSPRCPEAPPPPEAADPELIRMSTEYGSHYRPPNPKPFLSRETVERWSTSSTVKTRGMGRNLAPEWDTCYRGTFCEKAADPKYSKPITFYSETNLR